MRRSARSHDRSLVGALVGVVLAVVGILLAGVVTAVADADQASAPERPGSGVTATSAAASSSTTVTTAASRTTRASTTTTVSTTTTAPAVPDGMLRAGDEGPEVTALQARLVELGYWLGRPDGTFGDLTTQAVIAFQKAEGLGRDGTVGPATRERLAVAARPSPAQLHGDGIEIDLDRQLLLVVRAGQVVWALNTSTGTSATPTSAGEFTVERQIDGLRRAPLGDLYRPKYFDGGIAIHGFPRVPARPASHGCARLSYPAMDLLWAEGFAPVGTPVVVHGG